MAKNQSRRLRKKLCVAEFQELGFELQMGFKDDLTEEQVDSFLEAFLKDGLDANGLDYLETEGFGMVVTQKRGSVTQAQRDAVEAWLKGRSEPTDLNVGPLQDAWYPEKPINPVA